jgi:NADH:ubiquinone oxidoreductase subunit 4 (subunit M)
MERWSGLTDSRPHETFASGTLMFFILLVGIFPNVVADMVAAGVAPVAGLLGRSVG